MGQLRPWALPTLMLITILVSAPTLFAQTGHTRRRESAQQRSRVGGGILPHRYRYCRYPRGMGD